jgi:uncharacterized protein (TIGR02996 family)
MRTFTFTDGKSNKFWSIDRQGRRFTVRFGKIGASGQTQVKEFPDEAGAKKEHDKLVAEKLAKGYQETTNAAATAATAAPTAPAPVPNQGPLGDPTLTALLETCWENLDDNTPRLVLADWLEEHGEADRAEITRLEVDRKDADRRGKEWSRLHKRWKDLLAAHQREWLGPILADTLQAAATLVFCGGWLWEVGFNGIDAGEYDVSRALAALASAPEARWLTRLGFSFPTMFTDLQPLVSSRALGRLAVLEASCGSCDHPPPDFSVLFGSSAFPNLRRLALTGPFMGFDALALARSRHFPRLQSLTMQGGVNGGTGDFGPSAYDKELIAFARSPHFPALREAIFLDTRIRQSSLAGVLSKYAEFF